MRVETGRAPAVFLDRDGTLIRDVGYLRQIDEIEILPKVPEALRLLREAGFKLVLVTNQSAIARGWLSENELAAIHGALTAALERRGARLDAIYYCPHHPTEGNDRYRTDCTCRKPDRGMIDRAAAELAIDSSISYVVGDQKTDIDLARRIGAKAILLRGRASLAYEHGAVAVADDLWTAARWIVDDGVQSSRVGERDQ